MMNLNRTDIYRRLRYLAQMHSAEQQHNEARCFMVGREYELNVNNLFKGDIQNKALQVPNYFWSKLWEEKGFQQSAICADYPLVFLTPGERTIRDKHWSEYTFDLMVFDKMYYDRNNAAGNKTALREKEDIWRDTEKIARELLEAYEDEEPSSIYNQVIAGIYNSLPLDPATWTPGQQTTADAFIAEYLDRGNFTIDFLEPFFPFDYQHNDRLAGVSVRFSTRLYNLCPLGQFNKIVCLPN